MDRTDRALQLLAYHTALGRGTDVDKPRNLVISVTVESAGIFDFFKQHHPAHAYPLTHIPCGFAAMLACSPHGICALGVRSGVSGYYFFMLE